MEKKRDVCSALRDFVGSCEGDPMLYPFDLRALYELAGAYLHDHDHKPGRGRPKHNEFGFECWAPWYAGYCDPEFAALPMTDGRRFEVVAERLRFPCSGEQTRKLAARFRDAARSHVFSPPTPMWINAHRYAVMLGRTFTTQMFDEMGRIQRLELDKLLRIASRS